MNVYLAQLKVDKKLPVFVFPHCIKCNILRFFLIETNSQKRHKTKLKLNRYSYIVQNAL